MTEPWFEGEFPNWFEVTGERLFETHVPKDKPLRVLQIGAFTGDATEWLLKNREIICVHDVDTWEGSEEEAHDGLDFQKVEAHYDNRFEKERRVTKYKMTSDAFFALEAPAHGELYDFIYIDGDHTATQVAIDGFNAFRWVKQGGLIAFDDFTWSTGLGEFYEPALGIRCVLTVWENKYKIVEASSQVWVERF